MTNFDKIKKMSVEELAKELDESFACDRCPIEEFYEILKIEKGDFYAV